MLTNQNFAAALAGVNRGDVALLASDVHLSYVRVVQGLVEFRYLEAHPTPHTQNSCAGVVLIVKRVIVFAVAVGTHVRAHCGSRLVPQRAPVTLWGCCGCDVTCQC